MVLTVADEVADQPTAQPERLRSRGANLDRTLDGRFPMPVDLCPFHGSGFGCPMFTESTNATGSG